VDTTIRLLEEARPGGAHHLKGERGLHSTAVHDQSEPCCLKVQRGWASDFTPLAAGLMDACSCYDVRDELEALAKGILGVKDVNGVRLRKLCLYIVGDGT